MSYNIALNFEDGVTRFIECQPGETVADAAYRVGINIPLDCRDGACGTCKCRCESGSYDGGDYIEDALTEEEAEEGYVPRPARCGRKPICVVRDRRPPRRSARPKSARLPGRAARRSSSCPTARSSLLARGASRPLAFLPGQYVNIMVPGSGPARSYSFSSPPGAETLSFLIRDVPRRADEQLPARAGAGRATA